MLYLKQGPKTNYLGCVIIPWLVRLRPLEPSGHTCQTQSHWLDLQTHRFIGKPSQHKQLYSRKSTQVMKSLRKALNCAEEEPQTVDSAEELPHILNWVNLQRTISQPSEYAEINILRFSARHPLKLPNSRTLPTSFLLPVIKSAAAIWSKP